MIGHLKSGYADILFRLSYILTPEELLYNLGPKISSMQQITKKF
jgi:hypothetical protein